MKRILLILIMLVPIQLLFAQPPGWHFMTPISVTETSGSNVYDFQFELIINTQSYISAGQMNVDCSDIRFGTACDSANLNYYIQSGINTDSTHIWIKLDSMLANQTIGIYMYYGNPLATPGSAAGLVFSGPHSSTDSVVPPSTNSVVSNSSRGFRFTANEDLLVTDFGKIEPTGTPRYVTLWDFATQNIIEQTIVTNPTSGQYVYEALAEGVILNGGTTYVLSLYQGSGDGYYYGSSSQIGQHLTYGTMQYCNSCTQNTFPTSTLSNYHYGVPDFWYYTMNTITPAPTYIMGGTYGADLGPDTTSCDPISLNVMAIGDSATTYLWSNGATTASTTFSTSEQHYVVVTTPVGCVMTDSITMQITPTPVIDLGPTDTTVCIGGTLLDPGSGAAWYVWSTGDSTQTVTVDSVGVYYVTAYGSALCYSSDTINVTAVNPLPTVSATALPGVVCSGDTVTFSSTGANTYSWNNGVSEGANAVTISGDYIVMGTDLNYCSNYDTVTITVNPLPSVSFTSTMDTTCINYSAFALAGGSPLGGIYSGPGVTGGSFDPSVGVGDHSINYTFTDTNGCVNSAQSTITVSACLGIDNITVSSLSIYPNPSDGWFYVEYSDLMENGQIRIFDVLGKQVYTTRFNGATSLITLEVNPGSYLVELTTDAGNILRQRIVIR